MPRSAIVLQKAREFLSAHGAQHAGPLSVKSLAALAGVSYLTMWKAVREFKMEGKLHGNYRVVSSKGNTGSVRPEVYVAPADRVERQLTRDLLGGAIMRNGDLLTFKELTARYATSPQTLRCALRAVESQGLIIRHGRHYAGLSRISQAHFSIVLIAFVGGARESATLPPLERNFIDSCENACAGARVSLTLVKFSRRNGAMIFSDTRGAALPAIPRGESIAGYLYLLQNPEAFDEEIMKCLALIGKPVAVQDNAGVFPRHAKIFNTTNVRLFTASASDQPGRDVAAYMLSRGHNHAAYITPFHADSWSQERYEGARKVFAMAGEGFSLALYAENHSIKDRYYETAGWIQTGGQRIEKLLERWRSNIPPCYHPEVGLLLGRLRGGVFMWGAVRATLEPLLRSALEETRISALIMANDFAARIALQYCHRRKIAVPERIAIVGFDDAEESRDLRITTYNFNFNALATAIVHYLLHPWAGHWGRRRIVEIEGRIIERSTT